MEKRKTTQKRDENTDLGGTMRLGAYDAVLKKGSKVEEIYKANKINERHRHRWEVNIDYKSILKIRVLYSLVYHQMANYQKL